MPRPKKPLQLKIVNGSAKENPDRIAVHEPEFGTPDSSPPPDDLDKIGKNKWIEIFPLLRNAGVLKITDLGTLKNYCTHWSVYTEAAALIRSQGVVMEILDGSTKKNPAVNILNEASKEIRALEGLLGLNPSARGGLDLGKKRAESFASRRH